MAEPSENMVLRTVYLPKDVDQILKIAAIRGNRSKGDAIRDLIRQGLADFGKNASQSPRADVSKTPVKASGVKRRAAVKPARKVRTATKRRARVSAKSA